MLRELIELTRVRLILFVREPEALFWVFVFPLVLAGILGWAFREGGATPSRIGLLPEAEAAGERLTDAEVFDTSFVDAQHGWAFARTNAPHNTTATV